MIAGHPGALDEDAVVRLLISHGLLEPNAVTRGRVWIDLVTRRNRNMQIYVENGRGLFVKQAERHAPYSRASLLVEGNFYARHGCSDGVRPFVPALYFMDASLPLLVLELLDTHVPLNYACRTFSHPYFPIGIWRVLGKMLGVLHQTLLGPNVSETDSVLLVSNLHEPSPDALRRLSPGNIELLKLIQSSPAITGGLQRLSADWAFDAIVHGDVRADNILVCDQGNQYDVRLVDWEMCHVGDSAWDLAGALEAGLSSTLGGLQASFGQARAGAMGDAFLPLFQACCRVLWVEYCDIRELGIKERKALAIRASMMTAARIIQLATEMATPLEAVPDELVDLLQVSENIFADPERATLELFGFV